MKKWYEIEQRSNSLLRNTIEEQNNLNLYEGLIYSVPRTEILHYLQKLKKEDSSLVIYNTKLFPYDIDLIVRVQKDKTSDLYQKIKSHLNIIGWFISNISDSSNKLINNQDFNKFEIGKMVKFTIEPKYDVLELDLPDFLYHASPKDKIDNILLKGLIPKSNNRKSKHPERIYVTKTLSSLEFIIGKFIELDNKRYSKLKIDISNLIYGTKFYWDPNFMDDENKTSLGLYTLSNIPPNAIELMKE